LFSSSLDGYINRYDITISPTQIPTEEPTDQEPTNAPTESPTQSETYYFSYTGYDQAASVPYFSTYMFVQLWGAGGGSLGSGTNDFYNTGNAGGGGYTDAYILLDGIMSLKVIVGGGGQSANAGSSLSSTYGGGGGDYFFEDYRYGLASGGGRSAIQIFDYDYSGYVDIVTAGGGGGAGGSGNCTSIVEGVCDGPCGDGSGGAGGGRTAKHASDTDTVGGSGGTLYYGGSKAPSDGYQDGYQYNGGYGGQLGAGGGGGYYGGGSGGQLYNCIGGGGGGSSFVDENYIVTDSEYHIMGGFSPDVANSESIPESYQGNIGSGAVATFELNSGSNGKNGLVIITFY